MQNVQIDTSLIPKADARNLASTFLEAIKRFYKDSENLKEFEEWKASRKQEE